MKKILFYYLLYVLLVFSLYSAPPHPDLLNDPEIIERYNSKFFRQEKKSDKEYSAKSVQTIKRTPQTGSRKVLVLKIDFNNKTGSTANVSGIFTDANNSLKDYYNKSSYGLLNLDISIYPSATTWYRAQKSYEYYGDSHNERNVEELVREIVALADEFITYSNYDSTGDGYVDHLVILHSGNDEAKTGNRQDIWSHQYDMIINTSESVRFRSYAIVAVTSPRGVLYHEFGHELGMVDLYSTVTGDAVVGKWCVMDYGLWNNNGNLPAYPNAWHKILVGWVVPEIKNLPHPNYSLPAIANEPKAVKIPIEQAANPVTEYYLLENRQRTGYDAMIPGDGLLIWHIDDSIGNLNRNDVNDNHTNPRVKLITANNSNPRITFGTSGDPWQNDISGFGPFSTPAAIARNSILANDLIVHTISSSQSIMTFDIFNQLNLNITDSPVIITNTPNHIINWYFSGSISNISGFKINNKHKDSIYHTDAGKNDTNKNISIFPGKNIVSILALDTNNNIILTSDEIEIYYYISEERADNYTAYSLFNSPDSIFNKMNNSININLDNDTGFNGVLINKPSGINNIVFDFDNPTSDMRQVNIEANITNANNILIFLRKTDEKYPDLNVKQTQMFEIKLSDNISFEDITDIDINFEIQIPNLLYENEINEWNLFYFDPLTNKWYRYSNKTVIANNIIKYAGNHLTKFILLKKGSFISTDNNIIAYPNPYIFNDINQGGSGIFFKQIGTERNTQTEQYFSGYENIKIFTVNGRNILDTYLNMLPKEGPNSYWDIRDKDGKTVSSGTYIIYISGTFGKYFTKVSVIH